MKAAPDIFPCILSVNSSAKRVEPKTPQEAARLAEKRAKQAEAQHKPDTGPPGFTSEEILTALQENEEGDARLLVTAMKDKFAFDVKRQTFYRFKGGYWQKDLEREVLAFAGRVLRENYGKEAARQYGIFTDPQADEERKTIAATIHKKIKKRIDTVNTLRRRESVLKLASSGDNSLAVSGDEWNADPWVIQFDDQILDLKTGQARPGLPSDYITKAAPTKWKGLGEPAVSWAMFLREIFDEDAELVAYMQRVLGCALVGVPSMSSIRWYTHCPGTWYTNIS